MDTTSLHNTEKPASRPGWTWNSFSLPTELCMVNPYSNLYVSDPTPTPQPSTTSQSPQPLPSSPPLKKPKVKSKRAPHADLRFAEWGQHVVDKLHRFVKCHEVYVSSSRFACERDHALALSMRARIDSVCINVESKQSALSIYVVPPAPIQAMFDARPRPNFLKHVSIQEREIMHLATYMSIMLSLCDSSMVRMYDDVQCDIVWHLAISSTATYLPPPHASSLPLSSFIPTCVLFAQDFNRLRRYGHYLDQLMNDPMYIVMFKSTTFADFYSFVPANNAQTTSSTKPSSTAVVAIGAPFTETIRSVSVHEQCDAGTQTDASRDDEPDIVEEQEVDEKKVDMDVPMEISGDDEPEEPQEQQKKRRQNVLQRSWKRVLRPRVTTLRQDSVKRRKL